MISIAALWLPIVVAALLVFLVSSLVHMVLTYHRSDYRALPRETDTLAGLRGAGLSPGTYFFPYCAAPKEMGSPAMIAKYREGPVGILTVMPSAPPAMSKLLGQWFLFCVVVGVLVAYLTGHTVARGADYLAVFRVAGATAFLAYGVGQLADSIWKGQAWSTTMKALFDGLLYSLVTAGAFGWLWPR